MLSRTYKRPPLVLAAAAGAAPTQPNGAESSGAAGAPANSAASELAPPPPACPSRRLQSSITDSREHRATMAESQVSGLGVASVWARREWQTKRK